MNLRPIVRLAACVCVVALVVLSWLPKDMEARTGLPGQLEHVAAYAGTAFFVALGFERRARLLIGLIVLAGVLERTDLDPWPHVAGDRLRRE